MLPKRCGGGVGMIGPCSHDPLADVQITVSSDQLQQALRPIVPSDVGDDGDGKNDFECLDFARLAADMLLLWIMPDYARPPSLDGEDCVSQWTDMQERWNARRVSRPPHSLSSS